MSEGFWRDRPVFVTGATGLVGGWLVQRLLRSRADVVCLVRDWVPQSRLLSDSLLEQVKIVRGDIRDQEVVERAIGEYEIDTVIHLAAQTTVGVANRESGLNARFQHSWNLVCARGVPPLAAGEADRGGVLGQGLREQG